MDTASNKSLVHHYTWVDSPDFLQRVVQDKSPKRIGVDTEFFRYNTFYPRLLLVQIIFDDDSIYIIDAKIKSMAPILAKLMSNGEVLKIFHAPEQDLQAFRRYCGVTPENFFDTQFAASLAGLDNYMGYAKMVEHVFSVSLPKSQQRSNWSQRPLSHNQLLYAANDVRYLLKLHDHISAKMTEIKSLQWMLLDNQAISFYTSHSYDHDYFAGDHYARIRNIPKNTLLPDNVLIALAKQDPSLVNTRLIISLIDEYTRKTNFEVNARPNHVLSALNTPLPDESGAPDARKFSVAKLKEISAKVLEIVQTKPVAPFISRKALEYRIIVGTWPLPFAGWREEELRSIINAVISDQNQDMDLELNTEPTILPGEEISAVLMSQSQASNQPSKPPQSKSQPRNQNPTNHIKNTPQQKSYQVSNSKQSQPARQSRPPNRSNPPPTNNNSHQRKAPRYSVKIRTVTIEE